MKPTSTIIWAAALVLFCSTCKKDSADNNNGGATTPVSCDSNTNFFTIPLSANNGEYWHVLEDAERNIVVLGKTGMVKYDYKGNLLWEKPFTPKPTVQNFVQANGTDYFIVSSDWKFKGELMPNDILSPIDLTLTIYSKYSGDRMLDCNPVYNQVNKPMGDPDVYHAKPFPVNQSTCYLQKLSKDGDLLWEKTFEGNFVRGNTIISSTDGNFFLLTYKSSGFIQEALFDNNDVFQDTIRNREDMNTLYLHKIDKDGQILWSKTYEGIRERHSDLVNFRGNVAEAGNHIVIQARHQTLILDKNGNELERKNPDTDCRAEGVCAIGQGNLVYMGTIKNGKYQVAVSNFSSTQIDVEMPEDGTMEFKYVLTPNVHYLAGLTKLSCYGVEGNFKWKKEVEQLNCMTSTCKGGLIYVRKLTSGSYTLTKTDEQGH